MTGAPITPGIKRERGIMFADEMVRAILAGRKTQTRRAVKPQPPSWADSVEFVGKWASFNGVHPDGECDAKEGTCAHIGTGPSSYTLKCPYGAVGDRLWVRECFVACRHKEKHPECIEYRADEMYGPSEHPKWTPSIHMPRAVSRITLEITAIRVQRAGDISDADILDEGIDPADLRPDESGAFTTLALRQRFMRLWERINGVNSWAVNPWVWALTFKRVDDASRAA